MRCPSLKMKQSIRNQCNLRKPLKTNALERSLASRSFSQSISQRGLSTLAYSKGTISICLILSSAVQPNHLKTRPQPTPVLVRPISKSSSITTRCSKPSPGGAASRSITASKRKRTRRTQSGLTLTLKRTEAPSSAELSRMRRS